MGIFDLAALQNFPVVERSVKQLRLEIPYTHIHCKSERGGREEKVDRSRVLDIASQLSEEDYGIAHQRRLLLRGGGRGDARVKGAHRHPSLQYHCTRTPSYRSTLPSKRRLPVPVLLRFGSICYIFISRLRPRDSSSSSTNVLR